MLLYQGDGPIYVLYAVAMVGIGMLSHTGNNVAMDSYGPISDNAAGVGELSWHDRDDESTLAARKIMADLDAVGNTTKAITKGVAIASAVIAAVSLFAAYITDVGRVQIELGIPEMESIRVSPLVETTSRSPARATIPISPFTCTTRTSISSGTTTW